MKVRKQLQLCHWGAWKGQIERLWPRDRDIFRKIENRISSKQLGLGMKYGVKKYRYEKGNVEKKWIRIEMSRFWRNPIKRMAKVVDLCIKR